MSCTTILEPTLPENGPTRGGADPYGFTVATALPLEPDTAADDAAPDLEERDGFVFRTGPYDEWDPGVWPWQPRPWYRRDTRTGRHRRGEAPDPWPDGGEPRIRPSRPCAARRTPLPQGDMTRTTLPHVTTGGQRPRPTPGDPESPALPGAAQPRYRSRTPAGFTGTGNSATPQEPGSLPPLQEAAWHRFLATTESFAAAHLQATRTGTRRFAGFRALVGRAVALASTARVVC